MVVELGILIKDIDYKKILGNANAVNSYNCITHDMYWTNKNLDGMTENEMKNACIRLRDVKPLGGADIESWEEKIGFQNYHIFDESKDKFMVTKEEIPKYIELLESNGYKKVFDTIKKDYQYRIGDMKSRIQIQDIKDIGVILYYDNPDYYELDEETQRIKLIDELNSYGFNFKYTDLGLDKLRTLYYKKLLYSTNQNGKNTNFINQ